MTDDGQLQTLINGLQSLSERLAVDGRYVDGALVAGGIQAIRALRTRLEPPPEQQKPTLVSVPEGG